MTGVTSMLCAIAKIDNESRNRLRNIQKVADSLGIPPRILYGHITLATFVSGNEDEIIRSCKAILRGRSVFSFQYEKVEVLSATSIVVISPKMEGVLLDLHKELVRGRNDELDVWSRDGKWKPHTTLVHNPPVDLNLVGAEMSSVFEPFSACVDRIEFSKVTESGYEIIDAIDLDYESLNRAIITHT